MNRPALPPRPRLAILRRMKTYLRTAVLSVAIATLCACGAKGPLFMPEEDAPLEMPPDQMEVGPLGAEVDMDIETQEAGPAAEPDLDADGLDETDDADDAGEAEEEADPTPPDDGA